MPKGRKVCKSCGKEVGLRTAKCDCGFEFTIKKKEEIKQEIIINRGELMMVHTPGTGMSGKTSTPLIPVMPEGFEISNWIENCQVNGEKLGVTFTKTAFNYMARQIWRNKDLDKALLLITEDFQNKDVTAVQGEL